MSKKNLLKEEKDFVDSISRKGFISYVVYILMRITVVFVVQDWFVTFWGLVWFYAEAILVAIGIIYAVKKASLVSLVKSIRKATTDGRLTQDEAWGLMREAWFLIIGNWADIVPSEGFNERGKVNVELDPELDDLKFSKDHSEK